LTSTAKVALVANGLTIGGTEKGLVSHALRLDPKRFDTRVVGVHELGPRRVPLEDAGIPVACAEGDHERLVDLLRGADIVHVWRAGAGEPAVPAASGEAGVPILVETNIFGLVDASRLARRFACRLFLSRSCAVRYARRLGLSAADLHGHHRVLPLPLEAAPLRNAAPPRREAKERLGLDPERPVVGRIGRADDFKWRNLLIDAIPPLLRRAPETQVLLVGATPSKRRRLKRRGVLESCLLRDPVVNEGDLATFYAACDVFMTASELGESQGLGIAEALAMELPVVTCSTPWVDNAQVEYVQHGRTGFLASHPRSFAEAVATLLADEALRRRLGGAGRKLVEDSLDPARLTLRLESLYHSLLDGDGLPSDWDPAAEHLEAFEREGGRLASAEFRPLTTRERSQVRLKRERERVRRVAGLVRPRSLRLATAFAREKVVSSVLRHRRGSRVRP
jgi:glycosyltransferase involved in cell wall biosynthesis